MAAAVTLTLDQLAARLNAIPATTFDLTPALKTCSLMIAADAQLNIAEGHSPDGVTFAPLKRPRRNSKGGDKPLRDKGLLLASVTPGRMATTIGPLTLSAGSGLIYAATHNFGRGPIPQRQFLGFSKQLLEDCAAEIGGHAAAILCGHADNTRFGWRYTGPV